MLSFYLDVNALVANWEAAEKFCKEYSGVSSIDAQTPADLKNKWYWVQSLCEAGRFDDDNLDKLTFWLRDNIDRKAETNGELEPFYSAAMEEREKFPEQGAVIDSDEFRENLLLTLRRWLKKALTLEPAESYYVILLESLVRFAELAKLTKSPIIVTPFSDDDWEEWRQG